MPYIQPGRRYDLMPHAGRPSDWARNAGELNFLISRLAADYIRRNGKSYSTIAEVRAAMNDAALEFYRRVAAPYEDQKILENGDVYEAVL